MNNPKNIRNKTPETEEKLPSKRKLPYVISVSWGVVLTLGMIILTIQGYEAKQVSNKYEEMVDDLENGNRVLMNELQAAVQKNSELVAKLDLQNSEIRVDMAEMKNQRMAIDALYKKLNNSKLIWTLGEIEHALIIAEQQLSLSGSVQNALKTLLQVRQIIDLSGLPQLRSISQLVREDIRKLEAVKSVDWDDSSRELGRIARGVQSLPLAVSNDSVVSSGDISSEYADKDKDHFWMGLWDNIKSLVKVDTLNAGGKYIFDKEQEFFLKENIKMRLLSARLALMFRDGKILEEEIGEAINLINGFLNLKSSDVMEFKNFLEGLINQSTDLQLPSLEATIDAVRRSY